MDPLHARKMAALLQASTGSDNPVLLRYETEGGHTGSGSVDKMIDQTCGRTEFRGSQDRAHERQLNSTEPRACGSGLGRRVGSAPSRGSVVEIRLSRDFGCARFRTLR